MVQFSCIYSEVSQDKLFSSILLLLKKCVHVGEEGREGRREEGKEGNRERERLKEREKEREIDSPFAFPFNLFL